MSYEVMRSVRQLIESGIGDTARLDHILDRLESGKYIYLADQRYLENLLDMNQDALNKHPVGESTTVTNMEKDLREINLTLERILQDKTRNEKKITDSRGMKQTDVPSKTPHENNEKIMGPKSEDITLLLSVLLGLISLHGIGHIYNHKIVKGSGLLVLSLSISTLAVLYFVGIIKNIVPSILHEFFIPVLVGGYFGLYAFQVLDSRRVCAARNAYILGHVKAPPSR